MSKPRRWSPDFCAAVTAELHAFGATLLIVHDLMPGHGAPAVRVGLHHGSYVERDGDFFGATANLAARVSGQAVGGEVLLTGHTAALAPDLNGVLDAPRGRQRLRNVREPVELFAAVRTGQDTTHPLAVDRCVTWLSTPTMRLAA
jgi:class 3 adenylate cyclase